MEENEVTQQPELVRSELSEARHKRDMDRRAKAISLLLSGETYEQIGKKLEVSDAEAHNIVTVALRSTPSTGVVEMRTVENARLDRAQSAIWRDVLAGDLKAIQTYLNISARRSRLNGLDAPLQIEMSAHVRIEMEQALKELQEIVLGEVVDDDDGIAPPWPEAE